jgi:hypothetical protein
MAIGARNAKGKGKNTSSLSVRDLLYAPSRARRDRAQTLLPIPRRLRTLSALPRTWARAQ